jgi:hypothetical protein
MRCCRTGARAAAPPDTAFKPAGCLPFCSASDLDASRGIMISTALGSLLWCLPILLRGLLLP